MRLCLCLHACADAAALAHIRRAQIQLQPLRAAWLSHPDLQLVLERCLTRKPPSTDDLKALLPTVWWPGNTDEVASKRGMDEAMAQFSRTLAKVSLWCVACPCAARHRGGPVDGHRGMNGTAALCSWTSGNSKAGVHTRP